MIRLPVDIVFRNRDITVVLVAALLLRLFFVLAAPLGTGEGHIVPGFNDEKSHLNYVMYLAENGRFPVQTMSIDHPEAFTRNEFEYYQPPLFYLLAAPVYLAASAAGIPAHIPVRLMCVLFGVMGIMLAYRTLRFIFPIGDGTALSGALFLAFIGVHVRFSSLVSNDSLLWLIAAAYVHVLVLAAGRRNDIRLAACLAVLAGAGMLTKSSFVLLLPALFVPYTDASSVRAVLESWRKPVAILFGTVLISAVWYFRNLTVYDELFSMSVGSGIERGLGFPLLKSSAFIVYQNVFSFWFPFVTWPYGPAVKGFVAFMTVMSTVAVMSALYVVYRMWRYRPHYRRLLTMATMLLVPMVAGSVRFSLQYGQVNFRHLLPLQTLWAVAVSIVAHRFAGRPVVARSIVLVCCGTAYGAAFCLL